MLGVCGCVSMFVCVLGGCQDGGCLAHIWCSVICKSLSLSFVKQFFVPCGRNLHCVCVTLMAAQKCLLFSASVYVCVAVVSSWHKHAIYCIDKCPVNCSAFMFVFSAHE